MFLLVELCIEGFDEFVGNANAGEGVERVVRRDALGIDDSVGIGELIGEVVMICDDDAAALIDGHLDEFVLFDAGVAGDEELHALIEHVLEGLF